MKVLLAFLAAVAFSFNAYAVDLRDAAATQGQVLRGIDEAKNASERAEKVKQAMAAVRAKQFYALYQEAKKSGIELADPMIWINNINQQRQRSGSCCQIYVSEKLDGGMFVIFTDGDGGFSPKGYGLVSSMGTIRDNQFDSTGRFSENCKYQVSVGNDSRHYDCASYLSGKLDAQAISGMKEMFVKYMKTYIR